MNIDIFDGHLEMANPHRLNKVHWSSSVLTDA